MTSSRSRRSPRRGGRGPWLGFLLPAVAAAALASDPVGLRLAAVPLDPADPGRASVGRLAFRGGLHASADGRRFGGISAARVLRGQRLVAVTDEGTWLSARLVVRAGRLVDLAGVEMGPLLGEDGRALAGKTLQDAESMAVLPDGSFLLGFEQQHRLLLYPAGTGRPDGVPTSVPPPPGLEAAPSNGGLEAMASFPDGRLVALTEDAGSAEASLGWVGRPGDWQTLGLRRRGLPQPADAALLPGGDLLVLERAYDAGRSVTSVRVRRVPAATIGPGATLDGEVVAELAPPLTVDNFEAIAAWRAGGETRVLLVSDDNFNARAGQRTLFLMFALAP
jgi:hypothetical protein